MRVVFLVLAAISATFAQNNKTVTPPVPPANLPVLLSAAIEPFVDSCGQTCSDLVGSSSKCILSAQAANFTEVIDSTGFKDLKRKIRAKNETVYYLSAPLYVFFDCFCPSVNETVTANSTCSTCLFNATASTETKKYLGEIRDSCQSGDYSVAVKDVFAIIRKLNATTTSNATQTSTSTNLPAPTGGANTKSDAAQQLLSVASLFTVILSLVAF